MTHLIPTEVRQAQTYGAIVGTDAADDFIIGFDADTEEEEYPPGVRGPSKWQKLYSCIEQRDESFTECIPAPLDGQWAGGSIAELSSTYGIPLDREEVAEAYEEAFVQAFIDRCVQQVDRRCPEVNVAVTLDLFDGCNITRTLRFDPTDIYDAALASHVRGMAREALGIDLDGNAIAEEQK